jgi:hypothetical protein
VTNEVTDDRLVRVYRKIRDALGEKTKAYEAEVKVLKSQQRQIELELLRRLQARGASQTKTDDGTAFILEVMTSNIADEGVFFPFVLKTGDLDFFQRRISITHLREYMKEHSNAVPPGLNIFKELTINVRAPKEKE